MYSQYSLSNAPSIVRLHSEPPHKARLSRRTNKPPASPTHSPLPAGFNFTPTQHRNPSVSSSIYPPRTTAEPSHKQFSEVRAEHQRRHKEARPHIRKTASVQPTQAVVKGRKNYARTHLKLPVEGPTGCQQINRRAEDKLPMPVTAKSSVSRRSSTDGEDTVVGSDVSDEEDARIVRVRRTDRFRRCTLRQVSVARVSESVHVVSVVRVSKNGYAIKQLR